MAIAQIYVGLMSTVVLFTRPSTIPKGCGVLQIAVFLLAGVMFLLPMYAPASVAPDMVFGGIVLLLAIQTVANVMLWRRADEMLRQVMADTSAIAFWALQTALFLYAAAERLGLVDSISAWAMRSSTSAEGAPPRPCSSQVYQVALMWARCATSSRRRPGVRRRSGE